MTTGAGAWYVVVVGSATLLDGGAGAAVGELTIGATEARDVTALVVACKALELGAALVVFASSLSRPPRMPATTSNATTAPAIHGHFFDFLVSGCGCGGIWNGGCGPP
ncbi:hypothetical protein G9444_0234 [Rhodococcus erythropolis]|uniref:Uncharacterized protein n=1 Tax=Rhodococcus erythropolis TaxID=1833 RepID=A0A6G9CKS2_RHOER|nr:hypothetical protein [Rhodococcus erythropolis]QIP37478.1 hypothetical protein G9444_0234 [Rhodococcus erythropolis]